MKDAKDYYDKLIEKKASKLSQCPKNSMGQEIYLYECPFYGDESTVIAVCHEIKIAEDTSFFDTVDLMRKDHDYTPYFIENKLTLGYEL